MTSAFNVEGYYDAYNFDAETLNASDSFRQNRLYSAIKIDGGKKRWEFSFSPNFGFLGNPDELLNQCELKLSFDRAPPYNSVLRLSETKELTHPFELKDVVAITEYVSSPSIREKFSMIDYKPFTYEFDECDVLGEFLFFYVL